MIRDIFVKQDFSIDTYQLFLEEETIQKIKEQLRFNPTKLYAICEKLLSVETPLYFSYVINELLNYLPQTDEEFFFQKKLFHAFTICNVTIGKQNDFFVQEKRSFWQQLFLLSLKLKKIKLFYTQSFYEEVQNEISKREENYAEIHSRPYEYRPYLKHLIREQIIFSLPSKKDFQNKYAMLTFSHRKK